MVIDEKVNDIKPSTKRAREVEEKVTAREVEEKVVRPKKHKCQIYTPPEYPSHWCRPIDDMNPYI